MARLILLADDSPHARRMGAVYLRDLGYEVVLAADGTEALAALEQQRPELILVDAALTGMGGMELCRRVKAEPAWRQIPVLILLGALAAAEPGEWDGADGVLRKPLSSAGLEQWLPRLPLRERELSAEEMLELAVREAARG